jgi:integrase
VITGLTPRPAPACLVSGEGGAAWQGPARAPAARNRALCVLGGQTGFRISALLSLRVGDVWPHGRLVARVSVRRRHMKGKVQGRSVVLLPAAQAVLAVWLTAMDRWGPVGPGTSLFRSRKGANRPLRRGQAGHLLRQAYAASGPTGMIGCHGLRKTFG